MIPILYDYAEKDFVTNGVGRLSDCISCVVTEERNGIYECEFEYPMDGAHFSEISIGLSIGTSGRARCAVEFQATVLLLLILED